MSLGREKKIINKSIKGGSYESTQVFSCLFSFVGLMLVGCSDQSQSPVSPVIKVLLEKNVIHKFVVYDNPLPPTGRPNGKELKYCPTETFSSKRKWLMRILKPTN